MPGKSNYGTVVAHGKAAVQFGSVTKQGAGRKNLGPSAGAAANPAPQVRSMGGKNLKGPDKGAGTS